ncbi:hypothetical protein JOF56_000279 [Kibdelosporangium banguiense]|uniref:Right-handed parallel beta-helix repeat-containing protein n=1 Tax=Kibdelosporangium banguiense TaxID=1365924 RepID=A0ABS4T5Z7_9PSEU|nr:hypothetical protein [Kibdelosporangium banguiense]MBP2319894.1 hypothetical protein [Kibdelosporangium banguiense]
MKARSVLAVAAVVASASVAVAMPASAGLTTYCEGEAGAVNVPGDLRVAAAKSCVLDGTTVSGTVTVEAGANLVITGGAFTGAVTVLDDGFFDAKGTQLKSTLTATDGYGFFLSGTTSGAIRVTSSQHPERGTYAYLSGATVNGDLTSGVGEVFAQDSKLNGNVSGTGVSYVDLVNSVVDKNLSVSGAALGSVFCASEVYGNATYTGNQGSLQLGGNGPVVGCDQASYWNGNLTVSGNHADVQVSNNIVRGNLGGVDNDPAPTGTNNRVRGTTSGQFVNLAAPAAARSAAGGAHDRADVDSRRSEAKAEAKAAGPAAL